jgi:uncharacterized protein
MIKKFFINIFLFFDKHGYITFLLWTLITLFPVNLMISSAFFACYPDHSSYFYVSDFSSVLNESTEKFIIEEAEKLENLTKAQVVVATVPETNGLSIESYSLNLANQWGIGDKEKNNGILILFKTDKDDKKVRIEVGRGLEGDITDARAGRILDDYVVIAKNEGKWNMAAWNAFVAVEKALYEIYSLDEPASLVFMKGEPASSTESTMADVPFKMTENPEYAPGFFEHSITIFISFFLTSISYIIIFVGILTTIIEEIAHDIYVNSAIYKIVGHSGGSSYSGGRSSSSRSHSSRSSSSGRSSRRGGGGGFGGGGASR